MIQPLAAIAPQTREDERSAVPVSPSRTAVQVPPVEAPAVTPVDKASAVPSG